MDSVDNANLVQIIIEHVYKYDEEGRRASLSAEEAVEYAKKLSKFIEED